MRIVDIVGLWAWRPGCVDNLFPESSSLLHQSIITLTVPPSLLYIYILFAFIYVYSYMYYTSHTVHTSYSVYYFFFFPSLSFFPFFFFSFFLFRCHCYLPHSLIFLQVSTDFFSDYKKKKKKKLTFSCSNIYTYTLF